MRPTSLSNHMPCDHMMVRCLNEYELIRKYRCDACKAIMMCACDKDIGARFLSHQLDVGCILETQERVPVTHGFVDKVCRECRGLPVEAYPVASIRGRTGKVQRYYWREIQFEIMRRTGGRIVGRDSDGYPAYREIEQEVIATFKELHRTKPKYTIREQPPSSVLAEHGVEQVDIHATFAEHDDGRRAKVIADGISVTPEVFVQKHYESQGWSSLILESRPFHVLFGVYMWLLIQDHSDDRLRAVMFGSRTDYEGERKGIQIFTQLPDDFGTPGYATRRRREIDDHLHDVVALEAETLFQMWLGPSTDLREYLWAHRDDDVARARELIAILPFTVVVSTLRYLVKHYWGRYIGWPDLLVYRGSEFFLAEVKASKDTLSQDQLDWIAGNAKEMRLPFRVVKLHRRRSPSK